MSTTSASYTPQPSVYSSGQTPQDINGLINLAILSGHSLADMTLPPALKDPNYIPPTRNQDVLNGFTIATMTIATFMVAIRFYWVLVLVGVNNFQWGYHTYDMKLSSLLFDYKLLYVYEMIFTWALMMIRLSLLFFLGRLFRDASRGFRILTNALILLNVMYGIASVFAYTFQCSHVKGAWDIYVKFKTGCKPLYIYYIISAFQLALDFSSVLVPIKLVSALSGLTLKKKIEVLSMFSLGLSACVVSIARCFYLAPVVESLDQADATVSITILCQLEGTLAVIAACIPAARQLFAGLSNEPKVVRITGKVVKSFRSMTNTNTTSSTSKHESIMLSSQSKSQSGNSGGVGDRDSQLLHSHYGNILGATQTMEREGSTDQSLNTSSRTSNHDDIEATAGVGAVRNVEEFGEKHSEFTERSLAQSFPLARKYNHQVSRYSPTSSPSDSQSDLRGPRPVSPPPRLTPMLTVNDRTSHGLQMHASFETTNSGVNSSTNSLELSHWDTLESNHHPAPLTPRPGSNGKSSQDWRDSVRVD
ncbi:hypothetical protein H072_10634 [Dactylellina haptotyla CBS 200.50]|uniref:Rhodopsin domain-containing protein n=1 Tax=Dactylellina haptotyla (strain CBS 200.50) TaxID=1284197 RepID=S8BA04_DACHA|nr:hypothetical protein H072_10634 [Dactylellina haptotyla CBS 200.50]